MALELSFGTGLACEAETKKHESVSDEVSHGAKKGRRTAHLQPFRVVRVIEMSLCLSIKYT